MNGEFCHKYIVNYTVNNIAADGILDHRAALYDIFFIFDIQDFLCVEDMLLLNTERASKNKNPVIVRYDGPPLLFVQ